MGMTILHVTVGSYAANETGLVSLNDYNCGCPGQNASYICTAFGAGAITVWGGTTFNCDGINEISLRHNLFQDTEGAIGECNNGAIVGYSIERVDNFFMSRLDIKLSAELQGQTVTCSVDDGELTLIGTMTLTVSTSSGIRLQGYNSYICTHHTELDNVNDYSKF